MKRHSWLLALVFSGLLPAFAAAEVLQLRNETQSALVVQAAAVVRGSLQRGRPYLVGPGEYTPAIVLPGNKIVTIYNAAMPNRPIGQGVIPSSPTDQYFGIVLEAPNRARLQPRKAGPRR